MKSRSMLVAIAVVATVLAGLPAQSKEFPPQVARGLTVPVGFAARVFGEAAPGDLPTSLTWGPSTVPALTGAAARRHGTLLYVTVLSGNPFGEGSGKVVAFEDEGAAPVTVATGLDQPLGVVMGPDLTLYVSETFENRGKVTALRDTDGDGVFESERTVIRNLPNGRHQTNGLTFGPDGMLYVANGNATDNGLDCGPELVPGSGVECAVPEMQPWSGAILRLDPSWTNVDLLTDVRLDADKVEAADGLDDESVLVARGFRNIYDIDFQPGHPSTLWTAMNGPDNPSGSEPIYGLDVFDRTVVALTPEGQPITGPKIEDAGFPSCIYDGHPNPFPMPVVDGHDHPGLEEPQDVPDERIQAAFGKCPKDTVLRPRGVLAEGHEGTSGFAFTRGSNFPQRYAGDAFVAEWGSLWNLNGGTVTGHKVVHLDINDQGRIVRQKEFLTSALPMDLAFNEAGYMYVADMTGQIFEVRHVTDALTPDVVTVDMRAGQFVPAAVAVVRGQTVCWVNADTVAHNVRSEVKVKATDPVKGTEPQIQSGAAMNSPGDVPPGGRHCHTFDGETAVYPYNSTVTGLESNTMRGTVTVLPVGR